jgi:CubicO group peptidase (beta-lactamase class C family)
VAFAGGFGVRTLGEPKAVDADTLFMIASNTKALTTLLLAKLVEDHRFTWETPVTSLLPTFRLGDADTTSRVLVKHLICACTGMPRQDMEWMFEYGGLTPEAAVATLATMQPTSKFGDLFQYSNPMAGAAGFTAGHVLFPALELGAAYDLAMQRLVFDPLSMKSTTFDFARAQAGNHAAAHAPDIDGKPAHAEDGTELRCHPARPPVAPAGINDMRLRIDGARRGAFLAENATRQGPAPWSDASRRCLSARTRPTVCGDSWVDTKCGDGCPPRRRPVRAPLSDMMWLPQQKVAP